MKSPALVTRIFVCTAQKNDVGKAVLKAFKTELKKQDLQHVFVGGEKSKVRVQACNCLDLCKHCKKGPGAALVLHPEGSVYGDVKPKDAADIVREHLGKNHPVQQLLLEGK